MSFPIYLILFFILPSFSLGSYRYQLLRNATIKLNFNISDSYGHSMNVSNCTRCLCEAFKHPNRPPLFTCGETSLTSFFCQFYYFMPARDEIEYPVSHTNLYLMTNDSFTSKDDCCNTTFLIEQMKKATIKTNFYNQSLRTIIYADNNRFVAADYDGKKLVWFNQSTLEQVDEKHFGENIKSVAYVNKRYYAAADKNIYVFNETSSPSKRSSSVFLDGITVIYPLTNNQLLVGTTSKGAYICEENADETDFKSCNAVSGTGGGHQVHAFYAVNETAFYIGWIVPNGLIALFTNESGSWQPKSNNIRHDNKTSHIAIDDCQRIWALAEASHQISIYDRTGNLEGIMNIGTHPIFSFLILSNYTLVISHENNPGLSRLVNRCASLYCTDNNDWRPIQELLITRFAEIEYSHKFRTINQDYGSFYYQHPKSSCIPDILKEKILKRHEQFMNYVVEQTSHRQSDNNCSIDHFSQPAKQTIKVTHRKKFHSSSVLDYLVKQIYQQLKDSITPNDYSDVHRCIRMLVFDFLSQNPSLPSDDLINQVINIIKTPSN